MTRDEIIAAHPIVEFVRSRGHKLKERGDNFETNACPITQHSKRGHTPVMIYPVKQSWTCHDCKKTGSVIDWLMLEKGIGAGEAMRELGGNRSGKLVKIYDYTDENGELLFQACRFEPKDFKQRRSDGKGGWIWDIKGVRRVLYRLPEVIKAQSVCLPEGEKDADNLRDLGFTSTTNPMGAGKWRKDYAETLRGKDVVVFGDNDQPDERGRLAGKEHVEKVLASLTGKAKSLKHAKQPDGFHDVSDYIESLKLKQLPKETVAQTIAQLIDQTPLYDGTVTQQPASERKDSAQPAEQNLIKKLSELHGPPIYWLRKDRPILNEPFFAALYAVENCVLFEADEQRFYQYDFEDGLYHFTSEHQVVRWLEQRLLRASRTWKNCVALAALRSVRHLVGIVRHLKGQVEEKDAFAGDSNLIHVANGVLDLSGDEIKLLPFAPELKSRNGIPIKYVAGAKAFKFQNKLLSLISSDDRALLLKFLGQFLTGRNLIQRILILEGLPDTSKSTTAQIAKHLIGERNCTELRTKHLANRFEIGRLHGRTLVIGADVSARFLNEEGAYRLKAIVGGDMLDAEKKCSNVYFTLTGDFNVLLTANCRLVVRLAGDRGAWERRIAIIDYQTERKGKRITDFARKLVKEEGSGILNLAIKGLKALRADIQSCGDIVFTDEQRARTKALLDESDGLRMFLKTQIQTKSGQNLTTEEIVQRFASYCAERKWTMASAIVEKQLPDLMLELFSVSKSNNIERFTDGKTTERKGYRGIDWRPENDYDDHE
jgi:P4 family phage/plasmid primase-like protien